MDKPSSRAGLSLSPFTVQLDVASWRADIPRWHLDTFPWDLSSLLLFEPGSWQLDFGAAGRGCCCHNGEKQQVIGTVLQAAQCSWKKKPKFLINPSTEGNAWAHSPQQVTSHGGWHWLSDYICAILLSCALVLSLVETISLEADKASSCWSKCSGPTQWSFRWSSSLYYTYVAGRALGVRRGQAYCFYVH